MEVEIGSRNTKIDMDEECAWSIIDDDDQNIQKNHNFGNQKQSSQNQMKVNSDFEHQNHYQQGSKISNISNTGSMYNGTQKHVNKQNGTLPKKPVVPCKYGANCYRKNPQHHLDFFSSSKTHWKSSNGKSTLEIFR